jgi:hypothetical protein
MGEREKLQDCNNYPSGPFVGEMSRYRINSTQSNVIIEDASGDKRTSKNPIYKKFQTVEKTDFNALDAEMTKFSLEVDLVAESIMNSLMMEQDALKLFWMSTMSIKSRVRSNS